MSNNDSSNQLAAMGVGDEGAGYIGEFSVDYIIAEIFKLFDTDGSGKITGSDMKQISKLMGWSTAKSKC